MNAPRFGTRAPVPISLRDFGSHGTSPWGTGTDATSLK